MANEVVEHEAMKAEFLLEAAQVFERMMKEDQEQMITFDQMEVRALEVGGKLERWLMEKCLSVRSAAEASACCPKCHKPLQVAAKPEERCLKGLTGKVSFQRRQSFCPSCRKSFFPSGPEFKTGR